MAGVLAAAKHEVLSWPTNRLFWWLMVLGPVIGICAVSLLLGTGTLRRLPVAVCDQDHTPMSREVTRWIGATPSMRVTHLLSNPEEGNALLRRGKIYGFFLIPRHFEQDVLRKRPAQVIAYTEGQHMATAGILNRDLADLGLSYWRKQDTLLRTQAGTPWISALAQSSTVHLDVRPISNPGINYRLFLLPGVFPALIQLCLTIAAVCTLDNLATRYNASSFDRNNVLPWQAVAGSLLPIILWYWLLACAGVGVFVISGDLMLRGSLTVLYLSYLLFILACVGMGLLMFGITDTLLQSLSVVSAYCSPALAFAGLTFPLASMPLLARMWAIILPITHLLKIQVACGQMGSGVLAQHAAFIALTLVFLAGFGAGMPLSVRKISKAWQAEAMEPKEGRSASREAGA